MHKVQNDKLGHLLSVSSLHALTNTAAEVVDTWGLTSLGEAVDYNQLEVVKYFITEHGVDANGEL